MAALGAGSPNRYAGLSIVASVFWADGIVCFLGAFIAIILVLSEAYTDMTGLLLYIAAGAAGTGLISHAIAYGLRCLADIGRNSFAIVELLEAQATAAQ